MTELLTVIAIEIGICFFLGYALLWVLEEVRNELRKMNLRTEKKND